MLSRIPAFASQSLTKRVFWRHLSSQTQTPLTAPTPAATPTTATTTITPQASLTPSDVDATTSSTRQTNSNSNSSQKTTNHRPKQQQQQQQRRPPPYKAKPAPNPPKQERIEPSLELQDKRLPVAQHLDPEGKLLPTSDWIHVNGTLPICSLDEVLHSFENFLKEEEIRGIVDLDGLWNPVQDVHCPTLTLDHEPITVQAAHVVISPFGRPNGWHLKLPNRSLVHAILARAQEEQLRVAWKVVHVQEYAYSQERQEREDPAHANNHALVIDDTMVRIENCPYDLTDEYTRYLLSRYDLAPTGRTVIKWKGKTNDGKQAPLMFVVRFASAAWARAAVRELQSTLINGKSVKLIPYPKQMRYNNEEEEQEKGE
jgi:hypothetical protein